MDRPAVAVSEPIRSPLSLALEQDEGARAWSGAQNSPGGSSGGSGGRQRPPLPDPNKKPPLKPRRNQSYSNLQTLMRPPPVPTTPKPASKRRSLPAMNLVSPRALAQAMQKEEAKSSARPPAASAPVPPTPEPPLVAIPHSVSDSVASGTGRRNSNALDPKTLLISAPSPRIASTPEKKSSGFFGLLGKKPSSNLKELAVGDDIWLQAALRPTGIWQQQGKGSFILPAVASIPLRVCEQWCYEAGRSSATLIGPFPLVEEERSMCYYKDYLLPHQHTIYLGMRGSDPIVLAVEKFRAERRKLKAMVRQPQADERMFFPPAPIKDTMKTLFPDAKLYKAEGDAVVQALASFDINVRYGKELKAGILYQRRGQSTEDEIYSNNAGSPEFQEFLEWIGTRIELKNWTKFRGGLNTTTNSTGVYSVYTTYQDIEIMFHVAMYIPFSVDDSQQVERKRHAGNDTVVIVFRDQDVTEPFNPAIFKSHFNHVFCIVQVAPNTEHGRQYRVAFAFRDGVAQYGPYLPIARSFSKSADLRQLILAKLINSDRAALHAPAIRSRLIASRKMLLQAIVDTHGKRKKR